MRQKLHAAPDVQILVNLVMPWAEARLRQEGWIPAAAAWLAGEGPPMLHPSEAKDRSIPDQENLLAEGLRRRWRQGELAAAALVAPILYGRAGSGDRSQAVRLHIETRNGYCADILMPYRIRVGWRWRGIATNRVHFSHPVAQESDSRFGARPAPL